jgi:hypothetical protein
LFIINFCLHLIRIKINKMKIHGYAIEKIRRVKNSITFTANGDKCMIASKEFYLHGMAEEGVLNWITEGEEAERCFGEQDFKTSSHDPIAPEWEDLSKEDTEAILEHHLTEEHHEGVLEKCLLAAANKYKCKDFVPKVFVAKMTAHISQMSRL